MPTCCCGHPRAAHAWTGITLGDYRHCTRHCACLVYQQAPAAAIPVAVTAPARSTSPRPTLTTRPAPIQAIPAVPPPARLGPNDRQPCGTHARRVHHAAHGQLCAICNPTDAEEAAAA